MVPESRSSSAIFAKNAFVFAWVITAGLLTAQPFKERCRKQNVWVQKTCAFVQKGKSAFVNIRIFSIVNARTILDATERTAFQ